MTDPGQSVFQVLAAYRKLPGLQRPDAGQCLEVASQGFSGARLWRIEAGESTYALRRWPAEHPSRTRLSFIHQVLATVQAAGRPPIAAPLPTDDDDTWVERDGVFWELTRWIPGAADYGRAPHDQKLRSALAGLAEFHQITAQMMQQSDRSPGLRQRRHALERLGEVCRAWQRSAPTQPTEKIYQLIGELLGAALGQLAPWQQTLDHLAQLTWPLQPCIRDIWHAHVFFQNDELTGIIDFGALAMEHPAADIARLLGSCVTIGSREWQIGLAAYDEVRQLPEADRQLVVQFAEANRLFSGLAWADWIYVGQRQFPDWHAVEQRLVELRHGLQAPPLTHDSANSSLILPRSAE